MKRQNKKKQIAIAGGVMIVIALIIIGLVWFRQTPPIEVRSFACQDEPEASPYQLEGGGAEEYFVPNQLIVMGASADLDDAIDEITDEVTLEAVRTCGLQYWKELDVSGKGFAGDISPLYQTPDLEVRLYTTTTSNPEVAVRLLNADSENGVFADLNYLIFPSSDPWHVGGDPWQDEPPMLLSASDPQVEFCQQLAFESIGLTVEECLNSDYGSGVRIGIFDTNPFGDRAVPALPSGANLTVYPAGFSRVNAPAGMATASDHGGFVASLYNAIVPQSDVELIEVLDEHNVGDLFTLVEAIHAFNDRASADGSSMSNTILNLSLGVHTHGDSVDPTVESLELALGVSYHRGAIIVAASGNDSMWSTIPEPTQFPAGLPNVVAVSASTTNIDRESSRLLDDQGIACYANAGQVMAPGADGGPGTVEMDGVEVETDCRPVFREVCGQAGGRCPQGIVGWLPTQSDSDYGYWVGTSFSTPMVSGLAARILSDRPGLSPEQTTDVILCTARDTGIIDLRLIDECLP